MTNFSQASTQDLWARLRTIEDDVVHCRGEDIRYRRPEEVPPRRSGLPADQRDTRSGGGVPEALGIQCGCWVHSLPF